MSVFSSIIFLKTTVIKRKWFVLLVIVIVAGLFFLTRKPETEKALTFEHPQRQTLTQTLEVSGKVDAKEKASLRFIAGGKVVYLGAQEGQAVSQGQTIATIDQQQLRKQLEQTLNTYEQQRLSWDQQQDDIKDRWIDTEEGRVVQKNELTLKNSAISVELQNIAINNTVMRAPFAGILVSSPVSVTGVQLAPTDTFELINPGSLIFRAEVDEADVALLVLGQKAVISLDAYPDEKIESTVASISYKSRETTSGTVFAVEFALPGSIEKYRLGMNGDVTIELKQQSNALTIPITALKTVDGKNQVEVKTGETTTELRDVEVGLETEETVEITSGLTEADEVVIPTLE